MRKKVVVEDTVHITVLNAGAMAGIGLSEQKAEDKGFSKNHWTGYVLTSGERPGELWQTSFGMNLFRPEVGSVQGQYAGSSRGAESVSNYYFRDVGSVNKPPPLGSDNASVGPTSAPVSPTAPTSPNSPTSPAGSGKPDDQSAPTFSDAVSETPRLPYQAWP
ncbi:hypothetical protein NLJ89_g1491 [Agrocybe chaxingu]|uniref:Uncharacterized protein n=1 Tax=Agrocybe chaxingu TaxID=84603 RepID=A0A9W8N010_9AGAR|nr:hypothetical protein NLJ89_g1491 [Agrocybe chaxingu]